MIDIKKLFLSFFFLLFVFSTLVIGQEANIVEKLNHKQLKKIGYNAKREGDIYSAIRYFERYLELKPNNANIQFQLAELYKLSRDYKKAELAYIKAYNSNPNGNAAGLFYYAQMLKANGEYAKAKEYFLKFNVSKGSKGLSNAKELKKLGKTEILGCDASQELMRNPNNIVIEHLDTSINKAHIELSPYMTSSNSMIYSSLKADSIMLYNKEESDKMPVRKFYVANKINGKWIGGKELEGPFNQEGVNTGNGSYSQDGNRFFFTKCEKNKISNQVICRIFVSTKISGEWSEAKDLGDNVNSSDFTSTMPTVGLDSKNIEVIYFISNRDKGKGGLDIWYSTYDAKSNSFREAKNAGKINTLGDEITPYYDNANRNLYFSSNGYPGLGNLDVFYSSGELKTWGMPENLGSPVNSGSDDLYFSPGKNKESGFFVSNRKGGVSLMNETCCDDIYEYKYLQYIHLAVKGKIFEISDTTNNFLEGSADSQLHEVDKNFSKGKPISNLLISLYLIDQENQEVFLKNYTTDEFGNYFFDLEQGKKYKVISASDEHFRRKIDLSTKQMTHSDTLIRNMALKAIPKESIVIKNIYYDFDKAELKKESKVIIDTTLLEILYQNPNIIIEISSHTDSKGADDYNKNLSQKRAESVVKYLIEQGVKRERLVAKGYGEEKPLAPNENLDGSDNPEGRQMNRRTEFKIIGLLKNIEINYEE